MLTFCPGARVHFALGPTDMRKSFNGLAAATLRRLHKDPLSGDVFAFCNRSRNLLKLLLWDGTGFWIFAKRLESGTFAWPTSPDDHAGAQRLAAILAGVDPTSRPRPWRRLPSD